MNQVERELNRLLNEQRENNTFHTTPDQEYRFYRQIAQGDLEVLSYDMNVNQNEGMGVLSKDALRNARYHSIILATMITRACMEQGLASEEAYTLSDLFIRQMDVCTSMEGLIQIKTAMVRQFTMTMHHLSKKKIQNLPVLRAVNYIDSQLTEALTPTMVATHLGLTADYLSRLFVKEYEVSLSRYILERKCHMACYMLDNSQASCTEIAAFLGFASCSYFIERFKQVKGMTPNKYRGRSLSKGVEIGARKEG